MQTDVDDGVTLDERGTDVRVDLRSRAGGFDSGIWSATKGSTTGQSFLRSPQSEAEPSLNFQQQAHTTNHHSKAIPRASTVQQLRSCSHALSKAGTPPHGTRSFAAERVPFKSPHVNGVLNRTDC